MKPKQFKNLLMAEIKKIVDGFCSKLMADFNEELPILAVDGSDVQIPTNPEDLNSFYYGKDGRKPHHLI